MCPQCGARVRADSFDFGVCRETGYHGAGERFTCIDCGAVSDAAEIEAAQTCAPRKPVRRETAAVTLQAQAKMRHL